MYSDLLVTRLNNIADEYRGRIEKAVTDVLREAKYRGTGAGLESVKVQVIRGTKDRSPDIVITIADHLNFLEKRKMQWTKQPPVTAFEAWASTKDFPGPIPGYKTGVASNLPPWKAKERILWAIAKSKQKFDKWKAKPWRKKSLGSVLKEMNDLVLIEFDKAIEMDFQMAITKGLDG